MDAPKPNRAIAKTSAAALLLLVALAGCISSQPQPLRVPLTALSDDRHPEIPARDKTLLVFLPGRGTSGIDFRKQGFIAALPDRAAASISVDLTFPYYLARTATTRLHDDIIVPARAAGYRRIWLVGCSVGGLGAISYVHEHPGGIAGIVAIAPYPGEKPVIAEIEAAGGLANWKPKQRMPADDFQRRLWLAIRAERFDRPGGLPLVLGYGTGDRFAYGQRLLADQLPADHVSAVFGFHDWGTWHRLWVRILASPVSPLPVNGPSDAASTVKR